MNLSRQTARELAFEVILFFVGTFSLAFLFRNNELLTGVLIVIWLIIIKAWPKKNDMVFLLSGAIIGPLGEIACINFGAWQYANPSLLGIPMWLPLAWGLYTIVIKRIADTIISISGKKQGGS